MLTRTGLHGTRKQWTVTGALRADAGRVAVLLLLAPLAACGGEPDMGSMTKQEAIDTCNEAVAKKVDAGWKSEAATASKDDRYWDVRGTSSDGFYHCSINAVNGKVLTMYLPM
jgi:hypothetical protein